MDRVAVITDIHANLPALEAALADVESARPDLILIGGDVAAGPMPRETLDRLMALGERARFIRGNADREVAAGAAADAGLAESVRWCADQLTDGQRDFLASLPKVAVLEIEGLGATLFCHGSPRSDEEIITAATPPERLSEMLTGVEQRVVVCGHTHMQFDRVVGDTRVVNAGSVGMPYGEPGAHWALLGPDVALERTAYDLEDAARRIRASGWPGAEEFAEENVLTVPSASEAIEFFEARDRDR